MPDPDELTPQESAEVEASLANTPAGARWNLLRQLRDEHKEHLALDVKLQPDPNHRDPDRAPMQVTVRWMVKARGLTEMQRWDAYVRYELKKRLGIEEPTSITEEMLEAERIRSQRK